MKNTDKKRKIEGHINKIIFEVKGLVELFKGDHKDSFRRQKLWELKEKVENFVETIYLEVEK